MAEEDLRERINKLNEALNSPVIKEQFVSWTQEKKDTRVIVKEYWRDNETDFSQFWSTLCDGNIKEALILTALEDIPDSLIGSFSEVVCPELITLKEDVILSLEKQQAETQIQEEIQAQQDIVSKRVLELITIITNESENEKKYFDTSNFEETIKTSAIQKSSFTVQFLLLARSCVLLQFATNLWLLYTNRDNLIE